MELSITKRLLIWFSIFVINSNLGCAQSKFNNTGDSGKIINFGNVGSVTDENFYCGIFDVAKFGAGDGPATLPQRCIYTGLDGTPSNSGHTVVVKADGTGNFTTPWAALNDSGTLCGDIVTLHAGDVYVNNNIPTLPVKNCDAQHWITIETDQISLIASEHTQITPCYQNVASLPSRNSYACPGGGPATLMPTLKSTNGSTVFKTVAGSNYYRLIGIEVTFDPGPNNCNGNTIPCGNFNLTSMDAGDHIIFDRMWIHGSATAEQAHGVNTTGSYLAIINSYLSDFHCFSFHRVGGASCVDAQAVYGGHGNNPQGPIKLFNDHLEGAGESFIWGGDPGTQVPTDLEVRRNYATHPIYWRNTCVPTLPSYCGGNTYEGIQWEVKNLGEVKNVNQALFEGNKFINNWEGDADQKGAVFLLTPKNGSSTGSGQCAVCVVSNLTFRYNYAAHAANSGLGGTSALAFNGPNGFESLGIHFISEHDNVWDDINGPVWSSSGGCCQYGYGVKLEMFQTTAGTQPHDITINHNTILVVSGGGGGWSVGLTNTNLPATPFSNLIVKDNIITGPLAFNDSANYRSGTLTNQLASWTTGTTYSHNVIISGTYTPQSTATTHSSSDPNWQCGATPGDCWITDTPSWATNGVGFTTPSSGNGGNYVLQGSSPYKNAGTDGKDIGADVTKMNTYITGLT